MSADAPQIHPSAIVDLGATIGAGSRIWHFCHISSGAVIGELCSLGQNCFVADEVQIGNRVRIQNNVSLYSGVIVEDDVFLGPSCVLTNVINPRSHVSRRDEFKQTRLRRGATVGANATIVCGVELGRYCLVGAGAVVTRDVAPFEQVTGTPARRSGWRCQCGEKLPLALEPPEGAECSCSACGAEYEVRDDQVHWNHEE